MSQSATIKSLPRAFRMMKVMQAEGIEWGEDYRRAAGAALKDILEERMASGIDCHLAEMAALDESDRRNGSYRRHLMTELGDIELSVPRTRRFSALTVVRAYARRAGHIDRMILACFVLGLSTRKVATALAPVLGRRISAGTVSQVAKTLDGAVAAFHRRPLKDQYPVLMLDGVVLSRKTGAGALKRPVLVALGIRSDGKKEIIDFRLALAESAAQWEQFLTDLFRRGLEGGRLEMVCVDGAAGLLAALPIVYPGLPVQRCWAHKIRNVLDKVRKADHDTVKAGLHDVMNATTLTAARSAARRFADRWRDVYPKAVECLRNDLDELLTCWRYPTLEKRKQVRTTNAIERRFREVRRRTRPMGVFQDRTSMDRILFAVFTHENSSQGVPTLYLPDTNLLTLPVRKGREVLVVRQQLGLEPPHLAGRCPAALDRLAADDPAHRGITPEPVGVVDILVAGETPIDGLAKEADDAVPAVPARAGYPRARRPPVRSARARRPVRDKRATPASEVTRDPWNSSFRRRSKRGRSGP